MLGNDIVYPVMTYLTCIFLHTLCQYSVITSEVLLSYSSDDGLHYTYAAQLCLTEHFRTCFAVCLKWCFDFCALVFGNKNAAPSVSDLFHNNQELNGHDYFITRESTTISTIRPNAFDRVMLLFFISSSLLTA